MKNVKKRSPIGLLFCVLHGLEKGRINVEGAG